jgi:hypothetical protein
MRNLIRKCWYLTAVALLFFASAAVADTANMTLTSAGSNVLGGVYVGPYIATINGVSTQVICDDWAHESTLNTPWTANVNTLSPLSNPDQTRWGDNQLVYDQVAWLVTQMLAPPAVCPAGGSCNIVGDISYAIWELTYCSANSCSAASGTPFGSLSGNDLANAKWWLDNVPTSFASGDFSNFLVYTPTNGGPPQQEFIVRAPESSAAILLGADLLGLLGFVVLFRRRTAKASS